MTGHEKSSPPPSGNVSGNVPGDATASFGFRDVPAHAKAGLVRGIFDNVAGRYDLMNDLMSLGVHRLWKSAFLDRLRPRADMRLLDVGGGTGDIAFRFLERGGEDVTVCDINTEMLKVGRDRAYDRGYTHGLQWLCGDAESLPLDDAGFDAFTIAFCIRNVTRIDRALSEARRVLKPGGRFLCLEFSQVILPVLDRIYDLYSFRVLPALGAFVAQDREAYQYLAESIRRFPNQDAFAAMIQDAGFAQVTYRNLSGGIAAMHSGWRI
ncbi:MAG: bifunctional demethylmenaquinone methyltransferase/2-methoxy-6-polyprenyl-1,4-benzoquinol methylase UbiE [Rhodospirillales bacterium]